jgi:hypothetical protein
MINGGRLRASGSVEAKGPLTVGDTRLRVYRIALVTNCHGGEYVQITIFAQKFETEAGS